MEALFREILLIEHRRDEETGYIVPDKGVQRDMYRMAKLQSRAEFTVYRPHSKVRPNFIPPFRIDVIGPLIWPPVVTICPTMYSNQGRSSPPDQRRRSAGRGTSTLWRYVRRHLPLWTELSLKIKEKSGKKEKERKKESGETVNHVHFANRRL